jgi:hypothetical protein
MRRLRVKEKLPLLCLIAATALPMMIAIRWWMLDSGWTWWDDSYYLDYAFQLYDALCNKGPVGAWRQFLVTLPGKCPLMAVEPIPFFFLFGRSLRVAQATHIVLIPILSGYLYMFCRRFWRWQVGVVAVLVTSMFPAIYGLCNMYMREYSLTTLVVATACHLVYSDELRRRGHVVALGVLGGIGLLSHVLYPLHVVPIYAAVLLPGLWNRARKPEPKASWLVFFGHCALILAIMGAIAGPWYYKNWTTVMGLSWNSAYGPLAKNYGYGEISVYSLESMRIFTKSFFLNSVSNWGGCLFPIGVILCALAAARRRLRMSDLYPRGTLLILIAWAAPIFVFMFGVNKGTRFQAPLLPAFGVALAVMLVGAARCFRGAGLMAALLFLPLVLICLHALFGVGPQSGKIGRFLNANVAQFFVSKPNRETGPYIEKLLEYLYNQKHGDWGTTCQVATVTDTIELNHNRMGLIANIKRMPIQCNTAVYFTDETRIRAYILSVDYVIAQAKMTRGPRQGEGMAWKIVDQEIKAKKLIPAECPIRMTNGIAIKVWRVAKK